MLEYWAQLPLTFPGPVSLPPPAALARQPASSQVSDVPFSLARSPGEHMWSHHALGTRGGRRVCQPTREKHQHTSQCRNFGTLAFVLHCSERHACAHLGCWAWTPVHGARPPAPVEAGPVAGSQAVPRSRVVRIQTGSLRDACLQQQEGSARAEGQGSCVREGWHLQVQDLCVPDLSRA